LEGVQEIIVRKREMLKAMETGFQVGRISESDLLMAQFQLETAETEKQVIQIELQLLRNNLGNNPE
jgi:outer membrane protein TolC